MDDYMKISICVPVYDAYGKGQELLKRNLDSIRAQTFKGYEVVITDNCEDGYFTEFLKEYADLPIAYYRNPTGIKKGISQATNAAIRKAQGELIKILYMDDSFAHENALQEIVDGFEGQWLFCGSGPNTHPYYSGDIHQGNNKLGSPSAMTIKNDYPMYFDEELRWLLDCDYYKRMYIMFGEPKIINGKLVDIGNGDHQETNLIKEGQKQAEVIFMTNKYAK
jgi:glycosyltransferase involved in cell wall biosynthesis